MGFTPNVVDGNVIATAWGNEIRDRTRQVFATVAERDSQWTSPPNGAHCVTLDTGATWRRVGGAWVYEGAGRNLGYQERPTSAGPISTGTPAAISGLAPSFTLQAALDVWVSFYCRHVTCPAATDYGGVEIRDGATVLCDGIYTVDNTAPGAANVGSAMHLTRKVNLASGLHTLAAWVVPTGGSVTLSGTATSPMWLSADAAGVA